MIITFGLMTLVWNKIFYNYCWKTNGTTMLKSADHDSMSGEHVGTTSGMIITSGKSGIWPLVAPKNQGFENMWKFPRGKRPRNFCFWIYNIWEEAGCCQVCQEGNLSLVVMNTTCWVWGKEKTTKIENHLLRRSSELALMDSWLG